MIMTVEEKVLAYFPGVGTLDKADNRMLVVSDAEIVRQRGGDLLGGGKMGSMEHSREDFCGFQPTASYRVETPEGGTSVFSRYRTDSDQSKSKRDRAIVHTPKNCRTAIIAKEKSAYAKRTKQYEPSSITPIFCKIFKELNNVGHGQQQLAWGDRSK